MLLAGGFVAMFYTDMKVCHPSATLALQSAAKTNFDKSKTGWRDDSSNEDDKYRDNNEPADVYVGRRGRMGIDS